MRTYLPFALTLGLGIAIALGAVALLSGGDDDSKTATAAAADEATNSVKGKDGFTLHYPDAWSEIDKADLGKSGGRTVAAVKRESDDGMLMIEQGGKLDGDLSSMSDELTKTLKNRFRGFKKIKSSVVDLPSSGRALSYTFVSSTGGVQNLVVIPSGDKTYTLNSVVATDSTAAAKDVAVMVRNFEPGS